MSRTASSTICFQDRSSRLGTGRDVGDSTSPLAAGQVEGEDQVVDAVGRADLVAHVLQDPFRGVGVGERLDLDAADAGLGHRLRGIRVEALPDPDSAERILVDVRYEIRATNSIHSLVFPFYLTGS